MNLLLRHLGPEDLERLRSGQARGRRRRRLLAHLEECPECRARYQWIRSLPARLEEATKPPLPASGEEILLSRRIVGERVILPVGDCPPGVSVRARVGRAAMIVTLLLGATAVSWLTVERFAGAEQAGGELVLEPGAPRPGSRVQVAYRPASDLQGESELVLRGILAPAPRYEHSAPEPGLITRLERVGDIYRGSFTLGKKDVYAQLVVESVDGTVVDDHGGRSWHVLASDGRRSLPGGLWAKALLADQWAVAYAAIRRAVELYPHDARFRASELSFGLAAYLSAAERDSTLRVHRALLDTLAAAAEAEELTDAAGLAGLIEYARTVGDSTLARHFIDRLVALHPTDPEAMWYRVPQPPVDDDPAAIDRYLDQLESLWKESGPHPAIAAPGWWAARASGRRKDILTWAKRETEYGGWMPDRWYVPIEMATIPVARDSGMALLRRALRRLEFDSVPRSLGRTVREQKRVDRMNARPLLVALSEALVARGDIAAGLDSLRVAATIGWSGSIHRRLAELELAAGDSLAAARNFARVAVLPTNDTGDRTDPGSRNPGASLVDADRWERLKRSAREEMHARVLARSVDRRPAVDPVYLSDTRGVRHDLDELRRGTVTVVAFWDPNNGRALQDLPELRFVIRRVRAIGGEVVMIARSAPSARLTSLLEEKEVPLPLYYDTDRSATRAFSNNWAPEYFVMDYSGRIRFFDSRLQDLVAEVDALLAEPTMVTGNEHRPNRLIASR